MNRTLVAIVIILSFLCIACSNRQEHLDGNPIIIDIQPFVGFPKELTRQITRQLKSICPNVIVKEEIDLPPSSFYEPRRRYRADTIINILGRNTIPHHVTIGLTNYDISTTNGKIEDWGIMGLGFRPGNACVVSTFRLNRQTLDSQFYKVCVHELGHTSGLDHCPQKTCFMRDAEGGNPTDEEFEFCQKCKSYLMKKGWHL